MVNKTVSGVWWVGVARIVRILSQLVVTLILANLIAPDAFGVMSMAVVFTGILTLIGDFGFGAALIQRTTIEHIQIESCLWLNVVLGFCLTGITVLIAPLAGQFYQNDLVISILYVLSINFPILSLGAIQAALLEREFSFHIVSIAEILASSIAALIAVACALSGAQIWSLVIWQLCQTVIRTGIVWWGSAFRPRGKFSWFSVKDLLRFSTELLGFNIVNYFARNIDYILIGRFLDASSLGLYTMAYNIMLFPISNLTSVLSRVLFPALSRKQNDLADFRQGYLQAVTAIAVISFPLMTGMYVIAKDFVPLLLGKKWVPIVSVIQMFVWVGIIQSLLSLNGTVYIALGYTRLRFWIGLLFSTISVIGIVIGLSYGSIHTTALGYTIASTILMLPGSVIPLKLMKLPIKDFLAQIYSIALSSIVMAVIVFLVDFWILRSYSDAYMALFLQVLLGMVTYCGLQILMNRATVIALYKLLINFRTHKVSTI